MSLRAKVDELNSMILKGEILDAFDKYYADDVVMRDNNGEARSGKPTCRNFEVAFVEGLTAFHGAELKGVAVNEKDGIAMNEWFFHYEHKDWGEQKYTQVAVQRWKDGKIVDEHFYQAPLG